MIRITNCKPGDLAIVVGAARPQFAANLGKIVEVLGPASSYFVKLSGGLPCWRVRSRGGKLLTREGMEETGVARDCDLRPILPGKKKLARLRETVGPASL